MSSKSSTLPLVTFVALALAGVYVLPVEEEGTREATHRPRAASASEDAKLAIELQDSKGLPINAPIKLNFAAAKDKFRLKVGGLPVSSEDKSLELVGADRSLLQSVTAPKDSSEYPWLNLDLAALLSQGKSSLSVRFQQGDLALHSNVLDITLDTKGPVVDDVRVIGSPETTQSLIVTFRDNDLKESTIDNSNFLVFETQSAGERLVRLANTKAEFVDESTVRVDLGRLHSVNYRLIIKGTTSGKEDPSKPPLQDDSGNNAGGGEGKDQSFEFSPVVVPERGPRVEFPPFLPPEKPVLATRPNPGDHVETRVARLYYFRDAHRVAQIVNRITQSYNRAAVTQAQRRAEDARVKANTLTDERRAKERAAIEAAQSTRRLERELQQAYQQIQQLSQQKNQLAKQTSVTGTLTEGVITGATLQDVLISRQDFSGEPMETGNTIEGMLKAKTLKVGSVVEGKVTSGTMTGMTLGTNNNLITDGAIRSAFIDQGATFRGTREGNEYRGTITNGMLTAASISNATIGGRPDPSNIDSRLSTLQRALPQLESDIAASRTSELKQAEESKKSQAQEDRAVEDQFRQDVAAAHEDPDTYAPGKKDSVDPVAQVSISVIGEGLLHLRGPIRGINTIRKMIDQIDTPVGQVKVGINTVQINGEKGDKMELVAGNVEGNIDLARFLTAQSLSMLRKSIQVEAAQVAQMSEHEGHLQVDRDRKYLYNFFGRDFIDELYEMDSEFLRTENKLLSLHSMDTINLNQAMFILALAKNDIRQRIIDRFMDMVRSDLPQAEWDFRRTSELYPHKTRTWLPFSDRTHIEEHTLARVYRNAQQRYHFRSFRGFFDADAGVACGPDGSPLSDGLMASDTMNSTQRTFLRLAQIFKSQMLAEQEVKQRVIERAIIEDNREDSIQEEDEIRQVRRRRALENRKKADLAQEEAQRVFHNTFLALDAALQDAMDATRDAGGKAWRATTTIHEIDEKLKSAQRAFQTKTGGSGAKSKEPERALARLQEQLLPEVRRQTDELKTLHNELDQVVPKTTQLMDERRSTLAGLHRASEEIQNENAAQAMVHAKSSAEAMLRLIEHYEDTIVEIERLREGLREAANFRRFDWKKAHAAFTTLERALYAFPEPPRTTLVAAGKSAYGAMRKFHAANVDAENAKTLVVDTRSPLDHKKLLDFLIDEREEKFIELREGTRSYINAVDNQLKRLATALEDDFKLQFYDPAFVRIRTAARSEAVTLGQVERTTILMNNRAIAIVRPSASMEFDLPKRDIVIVEALNGAKALAQDYGALLNDPTFLAAFQMMGGAKQPAAVKNLVPGLGTTTDQQNMGLTSSTPEKAPSSLQSLVPDPAIYKFETGTAFEIRPVIQPDGESIVYDFNYMYTTNVNEPVRADEKHLGRIKRHFIDTQVQTSSFEMREVSRYQVALKAARTSRGVPLFEDIPGVGVLFKPLPSAESSLQQNVILAQSTVYPTLFDLMGLRWARQVVDLDHEGLRDSEHVIRGRQQSIEDFVFDKASKDVDEFLDIPNKYDEHHRPDLYRQQRRPSPYHPGGYVKPEIDDPTGRDFRKPDRRPVELREEPRYDDRFRRPYEPEVIEGQPQDPLGVRTTRPEDPARSYAPRNAYTPPRPISPATYVAPIRNRGEPGTASRSQERLAPIIHVMPQQRRPGP